MTFLTSKRARSSTPASCAGVALVSEWVPFGPGGGAAGAACAVCATCVCGLCAVCAVCTGAGCGAWVGAGAVGAPDPAAAASAGVGAPVDQVGVADPSCSGLPDAPCAVSAALRSGSGWSELAGVVG